MAVAAALVLAGHTAHADVFSFKDLDGFEKCLQLDHLVETVTTPKGTQARILGPVEIQVRCLEAAVKLLGQKKDRVEAVAFIASARRHTAWPNAIDLVGAAADIAPVACNEMTVYEVLARTLEQPKRVGFFPRAKVAAKKCLKDPAFRADFIAEKDSAEPTLRANACEILLEERLVKACTAVKP